jgi:hypothetical protein
MPGYLLGDDLLAAIRETVDRVATIPTEAPRRPFQPHRGVNIQFVVVTGEGDGCGSGSGTSGSGCPPRAGYESTGGGSGSGYNLAGTPVDYYPAAVVLWDAAAEAWQTLGECYLMEANGRGVRIGRRYMARQSGDVCLGDGWRPLFITSEGSGPAGCTGASGSGSGCQGNADGSHGPVFDVCCSGGSLQIVYEDDLL